MKSFKEEIPTWALCYLINGDATGLEDEDIQLVDDWLKKNNVEIVSPDDDHEFFSRYPAFGLPTTCVDCTIIIERQ